MGDVSVFHFTSDNSALPKPRRKAKGLKCEASTPPSASFGEPPRAAAPEKKERHAHIRVVRRPLESGVPLQPGEEYGEVAIRWCELPEDIMNLLVTKIKDMGLGSRATLTNARMVNRQWNCGINKTVNKLTCSAMDPMEGVRLAESFPLLTDLTLSKFNLGGIAGLSALPKLKSLNLWGSRIGEEEIKLLSRLEGLQSLEFGWSENLGTAGVPWEGLKPLTELKGLRVLDISELHVSGKDLAYLSVLKELRILKVASIGFPFHMESLAFLRNLKTFCVGNTTIDSNDDFQDLLISTNKGDTRGLKAGRRNKGTQCATQEVLQA